MAARSLRKQVKQIDDHLGGVRLGEDVEAVHRARVALRRLRAALGMFRPCWKRKQVRRWKKQVRRLARGLGKARDHDVLIEFLASRLAAASDPALAAGIACLLDHVQRQRQRSQPRVLKAIDRFQAHGGLKTLQSWVRSVLDEAGDAEFVAGECLRGHAAKSVGKHLTRLLAEAPGLADSEQHAQHHAMRIAVKRLRYTLELVRPIYAGGPAEGELAETGETIKRLQTLLGEIHDCDVWVERFAAFARKQSRRRFGDLPRPEGVQVGVDHLRQERTDRRRQVFGELAAFWRQLQEQEVWERLAAVAGEKVAGSEK